MRRLLFLLSMFVVGLPAFCVYNLPVMFNWQKLVCHVVKEVKKHKGRSAVYIPELYQSEEYLSVQSEYVDYGNVRIIVTDAQGSVVKDDVIKVEAGGENLYYIGDLDGGTYEVAVEFDDFILSGTVEI